MTQPNTNANVVLSADVQPYQQAMQQAGDATQQLLGVVQKLSIAIDNTFKSAGRKLELFSAGNVASIGVATASLAMLDHQMSQVRATAALVGGTNIPKMTEGIRTMSSTLGVTTGQLAELESTLSGLGVRGADNITKLTKTFTQLQQVTGESGTGLATNLIQLTRSMGQSLDPERIKSYASAVANVSANLGTSATAVTGFAQAIQPLGKALGITETQLLGLSGAFSAAGADGTAAATAFAQMAQMVLNDVQTGNPQIKQFADLMKMSVDQISDMAKTDPSRLFAGLFDSLSKQGPKAIQLVQSLGFEGVRTVNAIQKVAQGGGLAKAMDIAGQGAQDPGKLSSAASASMDDLISQTKKLGMSLKELSTGPFVIVERAFTKFAEGANKVISVFVKLANMPVLKQLIQFAGSIAAAAAPLLGMAGAIMTLIPLLAKLGLLWAAIFSRSGVSIAGGFRDAIKNLNVSGAGAAMRASDAGTGPIVGRVPRAAYRAGEFLGTAARGTAAAFGTDTTIIAPPTEGESLIGRTMRNTSRATQAMFKAFGTLPASYVLEGFKTYMDKGSAGLTQQAFDRPGFFGGAPGTSPGVRVSPTGPGMSPAAPFVQNRYLPQGVSPVVIPGAMPPPAAGAAAGAATTEMTAFAKTFKSAATATQEFTAGLIAKIPVIGASLSDSALAAENEARATAAQTKQVYVSTNALVEFAVKLTAAAAGLGAGVLKQTAVVGGQMAGVGGTMLKNVGKEVVNIAKANPLMVGVMAASIGVPMFLSANKQQSQEQIAGQQGSFVGTLNSLNSATGDTTTSMKELTAATTKQAQAALGATPAWGADEVARAKDSSFKSAIDDKSKATTEEKTAQLQSAEIAKIAQTGPLNATQQAEFREQLLHLVPVDQAKNIYKNLETATDGFKQAPKDMQLVSDMYAKLGQSYLDNVNRSINPLNSFRPWSSKGAQRAMDQLVSPLDVLNAQSAGAEPGSAAQSLASAQFVAGLLGTSTAVSGNNASVGGAFADPKGATNSLYRNLADKLGLKDVKGMQDITSLKDFVDKMYSSSDANTRNTANRLFGKQGTYDFSDPGMAMGQIQTAADAAKTQYAAEAPKLDQSYYDRYNLKTTGQAAGTPTAIATGRLLAGNVAPGEAQSTQVQATQGTAEGLYKMSTSAGDAQARIAALTQSLGQGTDEIKAYESAVRSLVQGMIDLNEQTMSVPQKVADIQSQMANLVQSDPDYQQSWTTLHQNMGQAVSQGVGQMAQFVQQMDQFNFQKGQQDKEHTKQVGRANYEFTKQQNRADAANQLQVSQAQDDFHEQSLNSLKDFNDSMAEANYQYRKSQDRQTRDFIHQEQLYIRSVAQSMDPWSQVQSKSVTDAQQALANLKQQNTMFLKAGQQLSGLKSMGLNQNVIDLMGLSDPKNMEQLNRFFVDLGQNPELVKSFNDSVKDRFDWTQGLATNESSTQWQEMELQFNQAASDAAADFVHSSDLAHIEFDKQQTRSEIAFQKMLDRNTAAFKLATKQSKDDFGDQMGNMEQDYKDSTQNALDSINHFAADAFSGTQDIMNKALGLAQGNMKTYFTQVAAAFKIYADATAYGSAAASASLTTTPPLSAPGTMGINPEGRVGSYDQAGKFTEVNAATLSPGSAATLPHIVAPNSLPVGTPAQNQAWAKQYMQATYGWGADQFSALVSLWNGESGWRQDAHNPSGAHGIPQSLPANKMAAYGADYMTNPITQMEWGLNYIHDRYKTPALAWSFWQNQRPDHWYAAGAVFNGARQIGVGERGPEIVMPLNNQGIEYILSVARQLNRDGWASRNSNEYASKVVSTISTTTVDSSTNFNGPVTVQAQDPNAMANALKQKARMQALTRPDMAVSL